MKLLTKEIINKLPKLYTYDGKPKSEVPIAVKFFTPWSNFTWYVTEGEKQENGDYLFFGMVHGFEKEMGYFTLSDLTAIKSPFGLTVERDKWFENETLETISN